MRLGVSHPAGVRFTGPTSQQLVGSFQGYALGETSPSYFVTWDWNGRIKPRIDLVKTLGANAIRVCVSAYAEYMGLVSSAEARRQTRQVLDYCQQQGLIVHCSLYEVGTFYNDSSAMAIQAAHAAIAQQYPNVAGFDLWNECTFGPGVSTTVAYLQQVRPMIQAVSDIPMTCSLAIDGFTASSGAVAGVVSDWMTAMYPYVDFWDVHGYGTPWPYDSTWLRNAWYWKPWVMGEGGIQRAQPTTTKQTWMTGFKATLDNNPDCLGIFHFMAVDSYAGGDYGIYNDLPATVTDSALLTGFTNATASERA